MNVWDKKLASLMIPRNVDEMSDLSQTIFKGDDNQSYKVSLKNKTSSIIPFLKQVTCLFFQDLRLPLAKARARGKEINLVMRLSK
jgi:hypothetical protein